MLKTRLLNLIIILFVASFFMACDEEEIKNEEELLQEYLTEHEITTSPEASGLYYIETEVGTGLEAEVGDIVWVYYTGTFVTGYVFDESIEDAGGPMEFKLGLGSVIAGWEEGIAMMREGTKATLIVPSSLAYGSSWTGTIPPYSTLIFDVELIKVIK